MVDLSLHTPVLGQAEGWQWVRWKLLTLKTISSLIYHLPPPLLPLPSSSISYLSLNKDEVHKSKWLSTTSKLVKCWKYQDIAPISISVRKWKDQSKKYHGVFVITDAPPSPSPPLATQSLPRHPAPPPTAAPPTFPRDADAPVSGPCQRLAQSWHVNKSQGISNNISICETEK